MAKSVASSSTATACTAWSTARPRFHRRSPASAASSTPEAIVGMKRGGALVGTAGEVTCSVSTVRATGRLDAGRLGSGTRSVRQPAPALAAVLADPGVGVLGVSGEHPSLLEVEAPALLTGGRHPSRVQVPVLQVDEVRRGARRADGDGAGRRPPRRSCPTSPSRRRPWPRAAARASHRWCGATPHEETHEAWLRREPGPSAVSGTTTRSPTAVRARLLTTWAPVAVCTSSPAPTSLAGAAGERDVGRPARAAASSWVPSSVERPTLPVPRRPGEWG